MAETANVHPYVPFFCPLILIWYWPKRSRPSILIGYDAAKLGVRAIHFPHKRVFDLTNGVPDLKFRRAAQLCWLWRILGVPASATPNSGFQRITHCPRLCRRQSRGIFTPTDWAPPNVGRSSNRNELLPVAWRLVVAVDLTTVVGRPFELRTAVVARRAFQQLLVQIDHVAALLRIVFQGRPR